MKLFTFGDSWTEGVGSDLTEENKVDDYVEKTKIRHLHSWPTKLAEKLDIQFQNNGIGGCSNKTIFDAVCSFLETDKIKTNDLVVIMWSSSLRDEVPFFPKDEWHFWGQRYTSKQHLYKFIFDNIKESKNKDYSFFKKEYKTYFFNELYDETYYQIVNQNYILYLQFMFQRMGVKFLFCDAFDLMVNNPNNTIDKTHLINKNHYIHFGQKTMKDLLTETNRKDVWEDNSLWINTFGKHPNKNGYEILSRLIYEWIINHNLLEENFDNVKTNLL